MKTDTFKTFLITFTSSICCIILGFAMGRISAGTRLVLTQQAETAAITAYAPSLPELAETTTDTATADTTTEESTSAEEETSASGEDDATGSAVSTTSAAGTTAVQTVSGLVNINTATKAQLETLPGIGEVLAQRIIDYRSAHGGFTSVGQLINVSGIGEKKLADLYALCTVG